MKEHRTSGGRPLLWIIIAVVAVMGLGGLLVGGFIEGRSEATAEAQREQPVKTAVQVAHDSAGETTITLSPELRQQNEIRTIQPEVAPYQQQAKAYGSVIDLQPFTELGNTIASAKAQLAIAEAKLIASQAAFERAQFLHNSGQNFSTAQLQAAEAIYRSDEASLRAAKVQTENAAASAYQAWGPAFGQSLTDGTALAKDLVQHKKVLVQVTLPLGVSLAQPPPRASIETTTGQHVDIQFVSPAPRTDPKIQGISFFYTADAASGALPGMNVIALLAMGPPAPVIRVPATAIVWLEGRAWVYLQTAANTFTRREVPMTLAAPGGGYVVPVSKTAARADAAPISGNTEQGFPTEEPLVIEGAQMLLSQEFSAQIQVGGD